MSDGLGAGSGSAPASGGAGALLFPGQGVDPVAACAVLSAHLDHPLVDALRRVTGRPTWAPADLTDTRVAQPVIVAAGLLAAEAAGVGPGDVEVVAGHSLGEITALAFAGVLGPVDALDLVAARAELGHAAHLERPGRMVAALKLDLATVEWLRRRAVASVGGVLDTAVINGPRQVVLSGDRATADAVADLIADAGGVPRRLGIGGAFHSTLLVGAAEPFAARVAALDLGPPQRPVQLSTVPDVVSSAEDLAALPRLLARTLVMPVDWVRTMGLLRDRGVGRALDAGPGATLATIAQHTPILTVAPLGG